MTTADDIATAWHAIRAAEERYRQALRDGFATGVRAADVTARTGRSAENLRFDAMTDEQRAAERQRNAQSKRAARQAKA